jgi:hypothetical protein
MYRSTFSWRCVISFTPLALYPGERTPGGWVGPRASLDNVEKRKFLTLPGLELRPRSRSLYRLRYPGSQTLHSTCRYCVFKIQTTSYKIMLHARTHIRRLRSCTHFQLPCPLVRYLVTYILSNGDPICSISDRNAPVWGFPRGRAQKKLYMNGKQKQIYKKTTFR